jgi:pimeloyl-ACP methyl ester carboxylesterase
MTFRARSSAPRVAATVVGAFAAIIGLNAFFAGRATRRHPPKGQFVEVDGVTIHYVVIGDGPALVLLHGNGSMGADFLSSDLVTMLATSHRVFVFDRPGYGHSSVGLKWWTAGRQARILDAALNRLGVSGEIIIGHSWGTLVALVLGRIRPCKGLALLSGYYFASLRLDALAGALLAMPGLGDIGRWTLGPMVGWLMSAPSLKFLFAPSRVPARFQARFPLALSLRPKSLKSSGVESLLMMPTAFRLSSGYSQTKVRTIIIAGAKDRMVSPTQSHRLSAALPNASLRILADAGHMLHQTHATDVLSAVNDLAASD